MDTRSKVIFLKEVLARKEELFSKGDSRIKDEVWKEVYRICDSKGCIGLRNPEYLRRTTYQNIQRRAKEKYEKGLKCGMESVNLTEVDELLLEIIGRDKIASISPNETPMDSSVCDFQTLLNLLGTAAKPDASTLDFNTRSCSPVSELGGETATISFNPLAPSQSVSTRAESPASDVDSVAPTLQPSIPPAPHRIWSNLIQNANLPAMALEKKPNGLAETRKRPRIEADCIEEEEDEAKLRKQKLKAEIRLLEAQAETQKHEMRLKLLQIVALQRELGLSIDQH